MITDYEFNSLTKSLSFFIIGGAITAFATITYHTIVPNGLYYCKERVVNWCNSRITGLRQQMVECFPDIMRYKKMTAQRIANDLSNSDSRGIGELDCLPEIKRNAPKYIKPLDDTKRRLLFRRHD